MSLSENFCSRYNTTKRSVSAEQYKVGRVGYDRIAREALDRMPEFSSDGEFLAQLSHSYAKMKIGTLWSKFSELRT